MRYELYAGFMGFLRDFAFPLERIFKRFSIKIAQVRKIFHKTLRKSVKVGKIFHKRIRRP